MSNIPDDLKYTKNDEWARFEGDLVTMGISDYAQDQLTDIVFIELPEEGREVKAGEQIATLESVKSTSEIFAPVSGKIVKVNNGLEDNPGIINKSPYADGWMVVIQLSGPNPELLSAADYKASLATKSH